MHFEMKSSSVWIILYHEKYNERRVVGLYVWVLVDKCMCMCANVNLGMLSGPIGDR